MMNNRQGGEALINFVASRFKNGGLVAKFQEGGDVDDDYGTFGADELSSDDPMGMADAVAEAVEKGNTGTTAAEVSAAIDALSDLDRGEGGGSLEERDRAIQGLLDQAEKVSAPPSDPQIGGDNVFSNYTKEQLQSAVEALEKVRNPSLTASDSLAQARAELSRRNAIESGLLEDEKTVTQAATQIDPVNFLGAAGAATELLSTPLSQVAAESRAVEMRDRMAADMAASQGTFDPRISAGIMSDSPQQFDLEQMQLANEIFAKDKLPTSVFPDGRDPQKGAAVVLDRPMQTDRPSGVLSKREYEVAEEQASPSGVDADDMAGIGSVAPRSTVQPPPAGGIAEVEPEFQQARTPDELDEIQDFEDMAAAQQAATVGLQDKKAGLAGLGAFAGSPIAAAAPFARDIFKTLTQPDVKAGELLAGKGLGRNQTVEEVVNDKGQRIGVVVSDPTGVVSIQPTSISNAFDPALRDAYSKLNERESREREESGRGDEPILPEDVAVEEEAAPEKPPTIDIIPFRPEDFYYFNPQSRYPYGLTSLMNMRTS